MERLSPNDFVVWNDSCDGLDLAFLIKGEGGTAVEACKLGSDDGTVILLGMTKNLISARQRIGGMYLVDISPDNAASGIMATTDAADLGQCLNSLIGEEETI